MGKDNTEVASEAPEAIALVHAFLHVHCSSKIASKFSARFAQLDLAENVPKAEALANALVDTVKTAAAEPTSSVGKALGEKESKKNKKRKVSIFLPAREYF